MNLSKTTRLLSMLLLTSAFAAGGSASAQSPPDKSVNPSPVKTNALALLSELEKPSTCPADDTLCLAQIYQVKTEAAIAGLKTIVRIDEQREGIISDMQSRIDIRGGIIEDLKKIDTNSQKIDKNSQDISAIWREQHNDDKHQIADLTKDLESCRSNQKFVFLGGALAGGAIVWKVKGSNAVQGLTQSFTQNPFQFSGVTNAQRDFLKFNYSQTKSEEKIRQALKNVGKQ